MKKGVVRRERSKCDFSVQIILQSYNNGESVSHTLILLVVAVWVGTLLLFAYNALFTNSTEREWENKSYYLGTKLLIDNHINFTTLHLFLSRGS